METEKTSQHALQEFAEKLRQLEEENRHLREASYAFGQLAERLNAALQQELRKAREERPRRERPKSDRRQRSSTLRVPSKEIERSALTS